MIPGTRIPAGESRALDALLLAEARVATTDLVERCAQICGARVDNAQFLALVTTQEDLLRDLSRPASMDAATRRLAARVGLSCASAPGWYSVPPQGGESGDPPRLWLLVGAGYQSAQVHDLPNWNQPVPLLRVRVPGISRIVDPIEAMIAATLFLFLEPS